MSNRDINNWTLTVIIPHGSLLLQNAQTNELEKDRLSYFESINVLVSLYNFLLFQCIKFQATGFLFISTAIFQPRLRCCLAKVKFSEK